MLLDCLVNARNNKGGDIWIKEGCGDYLVLKWLYYINDKTHFGQN